LYLRVFHPAVELKAEVVLIQEPREGKDGTVSHPGFRNIMKEKKVWIAISNEAKARIDPVDIVGGEGYVQTVDITINKRNFRVVNVYDQKTPNSNRRPAEEVNWARLLRGRCIIAGDMNAHSQMWNVRAGRRPGNARFWEGIVEDFECRIWNTEEETRWGRNAANHSIIDLTLSIGDVELNWFIAGDEHHTGSDHAVIGWEVLGLGSAPTVETITGWDVSGWSTAGTQGDEKGKREKKKK